MAAQFQLVMRSEPNRGKVYPLEASEITIGRDTTNTIAINDAEISRRHAKLTWQGSGYALQDLGSTNGSFVNGTRLSASMALKPGDSVSFGENIMLQYDVAFDANATMVGAPKAARTAAPVQQPAPPPAPAPAPAPVYSGQVPAGPAPVPAAPKKGSSKAWIIIVVVVVVILCLCVGVPFIVDALKLDCVGPFKIITNIVGPMLGYSACS